MCVRARFYVCEPVLPCEPYGLDPKAEQFSLNPEHSAPNPQHQTSCAWALDFEP